MGLLSLSFNIRFQLGMDPPSCASDKIPCLLVGS